MLSLRVQSVLELLKACLSKSPELHQPCKKVEVNFRPKVWFGEGEVEQDQEGMKEEGMSQKRNLKTRMVSRRGVKRL